MRADSEPSPAQVSSWGAGIEVRDGEKPACFHPTSTDGQDEGAWKKPQVSAEFIDEATQRQNNNEHFL